MDNYLDIALIGNFITSYVSKKVADKLIIRTLKHPNYYKLSLIIYFISITIFTLLINYFKWYYLFIFLLIFIGISIYIKTFTKTIIFLIIYYLQCSLLVFFSPYLDYKEGLVLVTYPVGLYHYLLTPFFSLSLLYLSLLIKRKISKVNYEYNIELLVNDQRFKMKGYLDSGNTLMINNYPVIFLAKKYKYLLNLENEKYSINVATINAQEMLDNSIKGKISFKVKNRQVSYEVLISISNNREHFHDYDCLLNLNLTV